MELAIDTGIKNHSHHTQHHSVCLSSQQQCEMYYRICHCSTITTVLYYYRLHLLTLFHRLHIYWFITADSKPVANLVLFHDNTELYQSLSCKGRECTCMRCLQFIKLQICQSQPTQEFVSG